MRKEREEKNVLSLFRHAPYGWKHPWKIFRWHLGTIQCIADRARYGFCHRDLWDISYFYLGLFSAMPRQYADMTDSFPDDMEPEEWVRYLRELSGCFEYCLDNYDAAPPNAQDWPMWRQLQDSQMQEGMLMLQKRFWDL